MKSNNSKFHPLLPLGPKLFLVWGEFRVLSKFYHETTKNPIFYNYDVIITKISFQLTQAAADNIRSFAGNKVDYVKFCIDTEKEIIDSPLAKRLTEQSIQSEISSESPNYHLFKFKYTHASKSMEKVVFVYSIPSEVHIPIKVSLVEKMVFFIRYLGENAVCLL